MMHIKHGTAAIEETTCGMSLWGQQAVAAKDFFELLIYGQSDLCRDCVACLEDSIALWRRNNVPAGESRERRVGPRNVMFQDCRFDSHPGQSFSWGVDADGHAWGPTVKNDYD